MFVHNSHENLSKSFHRFVFLHFIQFLYHRQTSENGRVFPMHNCPEKICINVINITEWNLENAIATAIK